MAPAELVTIIEARTGLAKYGKSIREAADFYIDHLERIRRCNVTVSQLAAEVLAAKQRDGFGALYRTDLRKRLHRFATDFGSRPIASITVEELDDWLRNLDCAPKTRANFRANVGVMFSYAKQRRMIDTNPVEQTSAPKLIDKAPEIFTIDELTTLLNAAVTVEPDVVPMLAIGAFAGLRDAEIKRLEWSEINLSRGFIEVKASKAKSARRRLVRIQPNLAAWLSPYAALSGTVVPNNSRKKVDYVWHTAALTRWPLNGLRHSFASYRLAATNDAAAVASELGHTSTKMLYSNYRELVFPEEAERYWSIKPSTRAENIVSFRTDDQ
ncbi:MAG: tyrosine-type recombinase/integrase [Chthoniobacterales bacterium]|nr:tyrosine-type recombinase/integrase [Chthoniobacterales bacterium]